MPDDRSWGQAFATSTSSEQIQDDSKKTKPTVTKRKT